MTTVPPQTILIIDDHTLFRESLALSLQKTVNPKRKITLLSACNGAEALEVISQRPNIQLILTDLDMPGIPGLVLLQQMVDALPNTPIIMISASENHADIQQALRIGAKGYIPKSSKIKVLLAAIQLVLAGGTYLPPTLLQTPQHKPDFDPTQSVRIIRLTERQREILLYLQRGTQNKIIAYELQLSEATVKVHVRALFSILGAKNRVHAVEKARAKGLL